MTSRPRLAVLFVLALAGAANAQDAIDPPAAAKPSKTLMALTATDINPIKLLPPPPADGSVLQKRELDQLRAIQAERTPERLAQAEFDDAHEDATAFAAVLGSSFDLARLPATRALLAIVINDQAVAANTAKTAFHRHRPWIFDQSLVGCSRGKNLDPLSSYPSGHATLGFSLGVVLADLAPSKAQAIMTRAGDYGYSRLVCEVHYPSDIVASQALGSSVAVMLIHARVLQNRFTAARSELKAAGIE